MIEYPSSKHAYWVDVAGTRHKAASFSASSEVQSVDMGGYWSDSLRHHLVGFRSLTGTLVFDLTRRQSNPPFACGDKGSVVVECDNGGHYSFPDLLVKHAVVEIATLRPKPDPYPWLPEDVDPDEKVGEVWAEVVSYQAPTYVPDLSYVADMTGMTDGEIDWDLRMDEPAPGPPVDPSKWSYVSVGTGDLAGQPVNVCRVKKDNPDPVRRCTCPILDLMSRGCRCGALDSERQTNR